MRRLDASIALRLLCRLALLDDVHSEVFVRHVKGGLNEIPALREVEEAKRRTSRRLRAVIRRLNGQEEVTPGKEDEVPF